MSVNYKKLIKQTNLVKRKFKGKFNTTFIYFFNYNILHIS